MKIRLFCDDDERVDLTIPIKGSNVDRDDVVHNGTPGPLVIIWRDRVFVKMQGAGLSSDGSWRYVEVDAVQIEE